MAHRLIQYYDAEFRCECGEEWEARNIYERGQYCPKCGKENFPKQSYPVDCEVWDDEPQWTI